MNAVEQIHGLHAVQAVLARDPSRVLRLQVLRGREDARIAALLAVAAQARVPVERVDAARLARLAGDAVHQGVVAEVRPAAPWDEDRLAAELARLQGAAADVRYAPLVLAL
jgi:23S rRNA (guanosine2251-2'-O)-methyltransferase